MRQRARFSICYEGNLAQVDVNTLIATLTHFTATLNALNENVFEGEKINTMVNAFEPGSFIIDWELVGSVMVAAQLFTEQKITLDLVIQMFVQLLEIKKKLKGAPADRTIDSNDGGVTIIKDSQNVTVNQQVFNMYMNNQKANVGMEKAFESMGEDPSLTGIKVLGDKKESLFEATSIDFLSMAQPNQYLEKESRIIPVSNTKLSVVKVVFEGKRKWEFVYNGEKISAAIDDPGFRDLIDNRSLHFSKGDVIVCDMEISQVYDPSLLTYVNKGYQVKKFHAKESPATQQNQIPLNFLPLS